MRTKSVPSDAAAGCGAASNLSSSSLTLPNITLFYLTLPCLAYPGFPNGCQKDNRMYPHDHRPTPDSKIGAGADPPAAGWEISS